jgi:predicted negative regulator of RcsB-dependent stress response
MKEENEQDKQKVVNSYLKYSGLFFQMLIVIGLFAFAGYKLDQYTQNKQSLYTAGLSLVGVVLAIFQVLRGLNSSK